MHPSILGWLLDNTNSQTSITIFRHPDLEVNPWRVARWTFRELQNVVFKERLKHLLGLAQRHKYQIVEFGQPQLEIIPRVDWVVGFQFRLFIVWQFWKRRQMCIIILHNFIRSFIKCKLSLSLLKITPNSIQELPNTCPNIVEKSWIAGLGYYKYVTRSRGGRSRSLIFSSMKKQDLLKPKSTIL
jgi:hypothetical protein